MDDMAMYVIGYHMGKKKGTSGSKDPKITVLDFLPDLWKFDIGSGWDVRVKISSDVDNSQMFSFRSADGSIQDYRIYWGLYYCVYKNGEFMYARCIPSFTIKYQESFSSNTGHLSAINEYYDFSVDSGKMVLLTYGSDFLKLTINGSYTRRVTRYSWSDDSGSQPTGSDISTVTFSHTESGFAGTSASTNYVINGGAADFKKAVCELYEVCREIKLSS